MTLLRNTGLVFWKIYIFFLSVSANTENIHAWIWIYLQKHRQFKSALTLKDADIKCTSKRTSCGTNLKIMVPLNILLNTQSATQYSNFKIDFHRNMLGNIPILVQGFAKALGFSTIVPLTGSIDISTSKNKLPTCPSISSSARYIRYIRLYIIEHIHIGKTKFQIP